MTTEALEQIVEPALRFGQDNAYQTLDIYTSGLAQMYTGPKLKPITLTIRDIPASGIQLHIHEGSGGTAHLKTYGGEYASMGSYDAAMLDLMLDLLKRPKYQK